MWISDRSNSKYWEYQRPKTQKTLTWKAKMSLKSFNSEKELNR